MPVKITWDEYYHHLKRHDVVDYLDRDLGWKPVRIFETTKKTVNAQPKVAYWQIGKSHQKTHPLDSALLQAGTQAKL